MARERGVALILVLWMIGLLAVIAGNFAYGMRSEAQIARNLLSLAQARALADAGVQRAWYELMRPSSDSSRWQADAAVHEWQTANGVIRIMIENETGKIDINTAPDTLLLGLFRSVGLDEASSVALVDAVVDWRDADTLRRLHGAEENEYRLAGKAHVPTNAPFETADELRRVLGVSPELFRALAPALTVHSRQPGVNATAAPREVLLALPGSTVALVDQYMALRANAKSAGVPLPAFANGASFAAGSGQPTYKVRSVATMGDGTVFVREAIARISQAPRPAVAVLAWAEGESTH